MTLKFEPMARPAPEIDLHNLRKSFEVALPEGLYELLRFSNGGEWELPVQPFNFVLNSAKEIQEINKAPSYLDIFKGFFCIGGNGGGEYIAIDYTFKKDEIVALDMNNTDIRESRLKIADDFGVFVRMIGIN